MASSSKSKRTYDVFLSFRGEVRNNFVSHLYRALVQNGIHTFQDNEELRKGDNISVLMKAIEESCIAIIVFSENYTSSWWCLEEVAKIMECNAQKVITVRPVFYKVDPKEVRKGRASYARGLAKHESKHGKDSEEIKRWKNALFNAGNLIGWTLNDGDDEAKIIQEIVKEISTHLGRTPLHVAEHPVGIDSRVVKLKSMLNLESIDDVLMVGLWGQGGIGKTTLGKAIYNDISKQFEGSSFLANVRENSKDRNGLATLQEQLLNDILLPKERLVLSDVARGITLIEQRLGHKRVLVILDDVDHLNQLRALAGKANWFGNGSRILITTRDSHFLTPKLDWDHVYVYEVQALDDGEACELLSKHAFLTHQIRTDLVDGFLNHAKGLPLALEVLGSFLHNRREREWEDILERLSRFPDKSINDVLKISYDGLDEDHKEIFLHIACFFKGWKIEHINKVLNSCDFQATLGLQVLFERSMIRIESGILQMHDLIQSMGMDIVKQECHDPGRRSRLWLYDDVYNVLSCNVENSTVKAIVVELHVWRKMCINCDAFTKMTKLSLLILRKVSFQGPICLPNELRWVEWPGYSRQIEFSAGPKKLVGLDMRERNVTGVVKQFKGFQQLKYLNFSKCKSLVRMPDLSCTPNLEELDLKHCKNLEEADESIADHANLRVLDLEGCYRLRVFPEVLKSKNLQALRLASCKKISRFPRIPNKLVGLKELNLRGTSITQLPETIANLISLETLDLSNCEYLSHLPSSIYNLPNLKELNLQYSSGLERFPKYDDSVGPRTETGLPNLRILDLEGCSLHGVEFLENLSCCPLLEVLDLSMNHITSIPTSIQKRYHLSVLRVSGCRQLRECPELPPFLKGFRAQNCESLGNTGHLTSFHQFVGRGLTMSRISSLTQGPHCSFLLSGSKMPEWIFTVDSKVPLVPIDGKVPEWMQIGDYSPVEKCSVSLMVSKGSYKKFLGLALCVVALRHYSKAEASLTIRLHVNGKWRRSRREEFPDLSKCHIYIQYFIRDNLWGDIDFGQIAGRYAQLSLTVRGDVVAWGLRIICEPLENDLWIEILKNRLMDPHVLCEVVPGSADSKAESSLMYEDNSIKTDLHERLQDCQISAEEQS